MTEFNLEIRKKQLASLKQYIKSSEDNLNAILHSLGWNANKTLQNDVPKITCKLNKNHVIIQKKSQEHQEKCLVKSEGYDLNDQFLSDPSSNKSEASIKLSTPKKIEIFSATRLNKVEFKPAWNGRELEHYTSDRLISAFSSDERLALYDYVVKHTTGPTKPKEFTLELPGSSSDTKEYSEKEKLLLERNLKRRRTKYKSVHTSKKSDIEVLREVIDGQMSLYTEWIKRKQEEEKQEKERLKKFKSSNKTSESRHYEENSNLQVGHYDSYSSQYSRHSEANGGVITDWSHLYQGGMETDVFFNCD
ncbi:hypothetical protein ABEB36_005819 [Hypothenemus hampei]|uniref:Uncharacterized protein n=1 Tax=Hypothenemus hampei TaxID=57062 RepID=A0ABD1EZK0_HYPHA